MSVQQRLSGSLSPQVDALVYAAYTEWLTSSLSLCVSAEEKAREAESKARALELRLGGDLTRESRVSPVLWQHVTFQALGTGSESSTGGSAPSGSTWCLGDTGSDFSW